MSLIPADDTTALAAVIFGLAWLGFWADRNKYTRKVSGVPWVLTVALILSNTRVIPLESPAYGFVGQYLLPLGVPFLLFKANLRTVFTQGGWVLSTFLVASIGVVVGAVSGYFLFDLGEAGAKIAGTYAGAFIGGVVNFVAISQAVQMTPTEFSVSLGASAPASIVGLLILVTLPSIPFIRRHIPSKIIDQADAAGRDARGRRTAAVPAGPRVRGDRHQPRDLRSLELHLYAVRHRHIQPVRRHGHYGDSRQHRAAAVREARGRFCARHAVHVRVLRDDRRRHGRRGFRKVRADPVRLLHVHAGRALHRAARRHRSS